MKADSHSLSLSFAQLCLFFACLLTRTSKKKCVIWPFEMANANKLRPICIIQRLYNSADDLIFKKFCEHTWNNGKWARESIFQCNWINWRRGHWLTRRLNGFHMPKLLGESQMAFIFVCSFIWFLIIFKFFSVFGVFNTDVLYLNITFSWVIFSNKNRIHTFFRSNMAR